MKNNLHIYKFLFTLAIWFFPKTIIAQSNISNKELYAKRGLIDTKIYRNGIFVTPSKVKKLYLDSAAVKSRKLYNRSTYFLPAGPILVAGGFYLGYDAIKGMPKQILIDGTIYKYKERSIFQLLGGIGVFAVGVCLIEYANEFKATSVELYNNGLKSPNKKEISFGLTPSNSIGFMVKL